MAELSRVTAGSTILAEDLNQIIDLIEGGNSRTEAFKFVSSTGEHFIVKLSDAAGARKFQIQDSAGQEVAYIDSDGNLNIDGAITIGGTIVLPSGASAAPTTEGDIQWDSDDDRLVVGDGTTTKTFYPGDWGSVNRYKYRLTNLDLTSVTLADVGASSGNIAFSVAASTAYRLHIEMNASALGTQNSGGVKLGLTGPASPTQITIMSKTPVLVAQSADSTANNEHPTLNRRARLEASSTSFGQFFAENQAPTAAAGSAGGLTTGLYEFDILIINGANAGTVTLQAAQNTAAGTTTFDEIVAYMTTLTAG